MAIYPRIYNPTLGAPASPGVLGIPGAIAQPVIPRPEPLPAPAIARPEHVWKEFSFDDLPEQEARDMFERHIGIDPTQFMNDYIGPSRIPGRSFLKFEHEHENPVFKIETPLGDQGRRWIGTVRRKFRPHENEVYHDMLSLNPEFQGKGIGNDIFDRNIRQYHQLATPIKNVTTFAALDNGGYNWPGKGMLPDKWSWNYLRSTKFPHRLNHLQKETDFSARQLEDVRNILKRYGEDNRGMWALRKLTEPVTGKEYGPLPQKIRTMSLAKHLLRHQSFNAYLDLTNPEQMEVWRESQKRP